MGKILLTNKSSRDYITASGRFRAGTTKEFDEKEALALLGYSGEIVRAEEALGEEVKKVVKNKDAEIENLNNFIKKLQNEIATLKAELKKGHTRRT